VAFVLVFVAMVGVMVVAKFALKRNSKQKEGRAQKQLQVFEYIK
jgi:hypothetical protein